MRKRVILMQSEPPDLAMLQGVIHQGVTEQLALDRLMQRRLRLIDRRRR